MSKLAILKTIIVIILMTLLLASFSSMILSRTVPEKQVITTATAQFSFPHPQEMSGNLDIHIDMRMLNGQGGGTITVTIDESAASELRRRIDSIYYLTIPGTSLNRNNSKVDGTLNLPPSEIGKFVELVEDRLEIGDVSNQYDLINGYRNEYDGIFAGVDLSRKGGSEGVDIKNIEGLEGSDVNSKQDIVLTIDFGGSFPDTPRTPKLSNGEIIFYALFGYIPSIASDLNETIPDIRCRESIEATIVGFGSFSDSKFESGDFTKYRIPGGEIIHTTQTYDLESVESTGYIKYEPMNFVQSSIILSIFGLILGIVMLSLPRSFFKRSGRRKKKQMVHLLAIGFFLVIVILFFLGIDGWSIWIGTPVFTVIVGVVASRIYTPVVMTDEEFLKKNDDPKADTAKSNKYHSVGITHFQNGELDKALEYFERALEENIHDEVIWNDKGHVLRKLGRYEEALKCFNLALKINPDYDIASRNRRQTMLELKRQQ